jgi:hypothetical protein
MLPKHRISDLLRRCHAEEILIPGWTSRGLSEEDIRSAVKRILETVGVKALLQRLNIPFEIPEDVTPEDIMTGFGKNKYSQQPPPENPFSLRNEDDLDFLWNPRGMDRWGWASLETRKRAKAEFPSRSYARRSILSSLAADENESVASMSGAILMSPHEIAEARNGKWREGYWGVVILDGDNIQWRCVTGHNTDQAISSLTDLAIWPPIPNHEHWKPDFDDELRAIQAWLEETHDKPLPPPLLNWGRPDEDLDW